MGDPKLEWSTIKLCMANWQKIIPLGRLLHVVVDIEGVKVLAYFKVIQIVDDTDPYPSLLGLDWDIDMDGLINPKKWRMEFETNGTTVIIPLDPVEGVRYKKTMCADEDIDHIYRVTLRDEDWINRTTDGSINCKKYNSFFSYSEEELEK